MRLSDLNPVDLEHRLRREGLALAIGPFGVRLHSELPELAQTLTALYVDYPLLGEDDWVDFPVAVSAPRGPRRWLRPQVRFLFDGHAPFKPLPRSQAYPSLEWGLNWCMAQHTATHLVLHAAVIEREGQAVILPGPPGAGKSTLCAALVQRGWRLLSDELTLLRLSDGRIDPVPRPVSLKNESIDVIRRFAPDCRLSEPCRDTLKGTVAHLQPPRDSVRRMAEPARPAFVVVPRYLEGAPARFQPRSRARTLLHLIDNAFNFALHGGTGFERAKALIDSVDCLDFGYGCLDEAVVAFDSLIADGALEARA
ncbi:HprK-related kinase A [Thiohalobacter sp. IOR34]|uniref:HprK-related kinase A n=1 Tax=Thiohalobacter sp. IOR34 TaxID=3057176 RepID=UPI0025B18561|nr:HprK-related kinase A [Thiohalobacter sp. IOR34]WJW74428.1 HprK-related kinase A [Thiohalobacter sp. IOR34]